MLTDEGTRGPPRSLPRLQSVSFSTVRRRSSVDTVTVLLRLPFYGPDVPVLLRVVPPLLFGSVFEVALGRVW